jgi:hypothetical protein
MKCELLGSDHEKFNELPIEKTLPFRGLDEDPFT